MFVGITDCCLNPHMHAIFIFNKPIFLTIKAMKKTATTTKKTTLLQKTVFMAYILAGLVFAEHPEVGIPVFLSGIYLCHRGFFGKE